MMMDYLSAGARLRSTASAMMEAARHQMSDARSSCETTRNGTRKSLSVLDEQRRLVSAELATVSPLYRLAGLDNPGPVAGAETERLPAILLDEGGLPSVPSAPLWLAIGALAGGAIGAVAVFAAEISASYGWIAAVPGGALAAGMLAGMIHGRRAVYVAREHEALGRQWHKEAASFVQKTDRVRRFAAMSTRLNASLATRMHAREAELEEVARDTVNAAILLKDVLNTALLNEEGAFLDEVIEQLHGQKERIAGFADRIAAAA
ncbi:hypothetical protein [Massilia sp. Root335]|uniref:hypothetical protein n=1 Tax=Massilia sp. Root335 TaxID=1736517 RepID=UPI0006FE9B4A|nr:hypothetical protein [Massilia sp. Root335]